MADKKKKMSPALKGFLKKYGRFPKKGELRTRVVKTKAAKKKGGKPRMAKGKKTNGGARRQGVVSWLTSWIQLISTVANPIARGVQAAKDGPEGDKINYWARLMVHDYTGLGFTGPNWDYYGFKWQRMARGWGPPLVGYGIKKSTSHFMKGVKVSIIPKLR